MHKQLQLVGAMDMIYRCPSDYKYNAAASIDKACEPQGKLHALILCFLYNQAIRQTRMAALNILAICRIQLATELTKTSFPSMKVLIASIYCGRGSANPSL